MQEEMTVMVDRTTNPQNIRLTGGVIVPCCLHGWVIDRLSSGIDGRIACDKVSWICGVVDGEPVLTKPRLSGVPAIHWTPVNKIPQRLTILPPPLQLPSNPNGRKSNESGEGRLIEEPKEIFTLPECDPARAKEQSARRLPSLSEACPRDNAEIWGQTTPVGSL
ncbi:hypothetical protein BT69DRAFT_1320224 [Atractiella rhizophila]|nr:hypothetical protein BT69DRAFT_1320224 [Atractiella rhizophila]